MKWLVLAWTLVCACSKRPDSADELGHYIRVELAPRLARIVAPQSVMTELEHHSFAKADPVFAGTMNAAADQLDAVAGELAVLQLSDDETRAFNARALERLAICGAALRKVADTIARGDRDNLIPEIGDLTCAIQISEKIDKQAIEQWKTHTQ